MSKQMTLHSHTLWVAEDGSYGAGPIILMDVDVLTDEQWDTIANLGDYDRYLYVRAVMNGEPTDEWDK